MKRLTGIFLLSISLLSTSIQAAENSSPYIQISVNGLEEVAQPLNRLAEAVENLSRSESLSNEDQQKVIAIFGEMKLLADSLSDTIETTKQKISQTQEEISASIKRMIMFTLLGLLAIIGIICAAIFLLFRFQIAPLVNSTSSSLNKFSEAMENLSVVTKTLNHEKTP